MPIPILPAHVKWFIGHEQSELLHMAQVITPQFLFWLGVTLAGLLLTSIFNDSIQRIGFIARIHRSLDRAKPYLTLILRIGLGIGLILQLVSSTFLAPEFEIDQVWVTVALVVALAGLLLRKTLWISGLMLTALYLYATYKYGLNHTLDYVYYAGIIYYLFVEETRWKATATPVLYLCTGFSLAWVGLEKLTLPALSHHIMDEFDIPTFGFSIPNFVLISAFIELGLAWTFIVGILNRFVSIVVTLVFITITTVFGFTEVIGHTIIHTLLLMFIIEGEGTFTTPFHFHRAPLLRYLFVLVNFCLLLFGLMWVYIRMHV